MTRSKAARFNGLVYGAVSAVNAVAAMTYSHVPGVNWAVAAITAGGAFFYFRFAKQLARRGQ